MRKILHILIIFSLFVSTNIMSQDIVFKHYTVDDGLSQSAVNCITQTRDGYLWFGTQEGLNRYNGYEFQIYNHNPLDTNSLSSNWVWSIAEDKKGNLWLGTQSGLNYLDIKTNKVKRFFHDAKNPASIPDNRILGVYVDKDDVLWVKTIFSISKYDKKTGRFIEFEHDRDYFSPEQSNYPFQIIETKDGLWSGSFKGLQNFNKKYQQFESFKHSNSNSSSIADNTIYSVVEDKYGFLWVATQKGLDRFDPKTKKSIHFKHSDTDKNTISSNLIISLRIDHLGYLWAGTKNSGLNKINTKTFEILRYEAEKGNTESLSYNEIISIFEDNSENVWFGTNGNGMDKISLRPPKFKLYRNSVGAHSYDISDNMIASIYEFDKNHLWIGTWSKGLDILNRKTGEITHHNIDSPKGQSIVGNDVHVILERKNGDILLGTSHGISVYDRKKKVFYDIENIFEQDIPKLKGNRVYTIKEDQYENLWVGTGNGLLKLNTDSKEVLYFSSSKKDSTSLSNNSIVSIIEGSEGYLWIGTQLGLNKFNTKTHKSKHFISNNDPSNHIKGDIYKTLSSNFVFSIYEDNQGYLWIGTTSGINKYDKISGTFQYFTKKHGLPNETIYELIMDNSGELWFSSNRGIGYLDTKTEIVKSFDKGDGLQGLEYNNGASYKSKSGEIFFGGSDGLNSFYPDSLVENNNIPRVVIESYEKISLSGIYTKQLHGVDVIELNADDKSIKLNFAALEYTNPSKNQYQYKLEGFDNDWINGGTNHYANYSNLSQGEYTFRLKGSNNDLVWSKEVSVKIIVSPPWYLSYWAFASYVFFVISIIILIIRLRTSKLKIANQTLRQKQIAAMEIAKQKEELDTLVKNIRDSITYAERIQKAMMPSEFLFKKLLPESFILYRPKDIVSGDFYWIAEKNNKVFVAAVDCTGHGVPGAFMSIIGFDLLRNITRDQGVEDPAEILNRMNAGVTETFSKNIGETEVRDGMDIAIMVIDKNLNELEYAGALNPLYIIREGKVIEVKGNRFSIGSKEANNKFDNHKLALKKNDMLYIFSDGYADQFGGPLGKKYKFRRFRHTLLTIHNMPVNKQKSFLNENLDNWMGDLEQVDDVLLIGVRV